MLTTEQHLAEIATMKWRGKRYPEAALPGTVPQGVTSGSARMLLLALIGRGYSTHSGSGGVLWVVLEYLQSTRTHYTLQATPGTGYVVRLGVEP